jgi:endonuclease-3
LPSKAASRRKPSPRRRKAPARLSAARRRASQILDILEDTHPEATCALDYRNAYELLVATILSAQCTDQRVNQVTPGLFARFSSAAALAAASPIELEEIIRPTGFFRSKTKSLIGCARGIVEQGGSVPSSIEDLVRLPGVGRKTANVVLGHAYDIEEGIAVDTHVLRLSARLGLAKGKDAVAVESELMALIPRARWTRTTDLLIFHGRKICDARRPKCGDCPVFHLCRWESRQAYAGETTSRSARTRAPALPAKPRRARRGAPSAPGNAHQVAGTSRKPKG